MDVQWRLDEKLDESNMTDGAANATTLQNAHELYSDGGRDVTTTTL